MSHAGAATATEMIVEATPSHGGMLGLSLESLLCKLTGSHWRAVSVLTVFWMNAPIIMMLRFPKTAGRELESISPEKTQLPLSSAG